jgi:hypothetical protein
MIFGWYDQVGHALKFCLGRPAALGLVGYWLMLDSRN